MGLGVMNPIKNKLKDIKCVSVERSLFIKLWKKISPKNLSHMKLNIENRLNQGGL